MEKTPNEREKMRPLRKLFYQTVAKGSYFADRWERYERMKQEEEEKQ